MNHSVRQERPRLSRAELLGILGVVLLIFFFGTGPIWQAPWDMFTAIIASYLPIPLLVFLCLAIRRKLSFLAFFLDTLAVGLLKFGITLVFATIVWIFAEKPPPIRPRKAPASAPVVSEVALTPPSLPAPTPIDPAQTGQIEGQVLDAEGNPVAGALVFIEAGLAGFVFEAPQTPFLLEADGDGFSLAQAGLLVGQPFLARSTDGKLHTLQAHDEGGRFLFNLPALSKDAARPRFFSQDYGLVSLRCSVHPREREAHLAILGHPFFALTDAEGRFSFTGVPAGYLQIVAFREGARASNEIKLPAQETQKLSLRLPPTRG